MNFVKSDAHLVRRDLILARFLINEHNSNFIPKAKVKRLGLVNDAKNLTFTIPQKRFVKLKSSTENILNQKSLIPKHLAKIAGQLSSMQLALGPIIQFCLRNNYRNISNRFSSHETKGISKETEDKLKMLAEKHKFLERLQI